MGEVLYAEGKNVLIYLPEIGNAMLNAEDEEHLEKMLPLIPKDVSEHSIVTVTCLLYTSDAESRVGA